MFDWPQLLDELAESIDQRLAQGIITTEDTIRYYFLLRLGEHGIQPESTVLERPHARLPGKEIDLSVFFAQEKWDFEVKYHRPIPSGRNRPLT
jgi:hypothetical protein